MLENINKEMLSPQDLRKILCADNMEIVKLCRKTSIIPKKDEKGRTYFSMEEARILKQAKDSTALMSKSSSQVVVNSLLSSLKNMENSMTASITTSITDSMKTMLDERLEGMDEVVVELIRCKTENENLKNKINELNKENYHLKNELSTFKPFVLGFYTKKEEKDIVL